MDPLVASDYARYVVLIPALIVGGGLIAGILILLGRAFVDSVREAGHPRLMAGAVVAVLALVALLTYLGVSLPKE